MNNRGSALYILGAVAAIAVCAPARANTPDPVQQQVSRLQIGGSKTLFTIDAEHADVQSAIKAIMDQAGKQFDLDGEAKGQVTLKLEKQPLDVTLESLCRQTYLKVKLDPSTSIYHFSVDSDAIAASFKRFDSLSEQLRNQLVTLGIDATDTGAAGSVNGHTPINRRPGQAPSGAVGGFGGGGANGSAAKSAGGPVGPGAGNSESFREQVQSANGVAQSRSGQAASGVNQNFALQKTPPTDAAGDKQAYLRADFIPDDVLRTLLQANGNVTENAPVKDFDRAYSLFLKQNDLIAVNTNGVAAPVSDVIAELSRQSGVSILLDPRIPRGQKFRIKLSLPPCSLTEALNLVLPPARLKWRYVNNSMIFVTPTPDFQIFYGSSPTPNVIFGNGAYNNQQQNGGQQQNGRNTPGTDGPH